MVSGRECRVAGGGGLDGEWVNRECGVAGGGGG